MPDCHSNYLSKLLRVLIRLFKWVALLSAFVALCIYGIEARERWIKVPYCDWEPVPNEKNKPYSANVCYLTKETILLRVYDSNGGRLLAERSYRNNGVYARWLPDEILYDTSDDDSSIAIPPTMLDWLRARLP